MADELLARLTWRHCDLAADAALYCNGKLVDRTGVAWAAGTGFRIVAALSNAA